MTQYNHELIRTSRVMITSVAMCQRTADVAAPLGWWRHFVCLCWWCGRSGC